MLTLSKRDGINVVHTITESHSAKVSGTRPEFTQMILDLHSGKYNAILTWAPDRLSRNAGDLGSLVDLMDLGKLRIIKTFGQSFSNTPSEKFLLMILCSQAKLENDQKGVNVKRGIRRKCEMGWRPCMAPIGYIAETMNGVKHVVVDEKRAHVITEMFEKVGYYYAKGRDIKKWMDSIQFTTRAGKHVTLSMIYLMLRNPFYYGWFEYPIKSGKWYKGSHTPLIPKELFDEVQKELDQGTSERPIYGKTSFAFKGLFTCYGCGTSICAEEKNRKLLSGGTHHHIYYHCTRSRNVFCKEPYLEEKKLVKEIQKHIAILSDEQIQKYLPSRTIHELGLLLPILKELKYAQASNIYDFDPNYDNIPLAEIVSYAMQKSPIIFKREIITHLPIPKRLHEGILVQ